MPRRWGEEHHPTEGVGFVKLSSPPLVRGRGRCFLVILGGFLLGSAGSPGAAAGQAPPSLDESVWGENEATFLLANSLVSGLGAGIARAVGGGSFKEGFLRGALGGAVGYTARRIAAGEVDGSGLVGRQLGAVGASMVRNAGAGEGMFSRLVFPIGPLNLYVDRSGDQARWSAKIDGPALVTAGILVFHADAELDWWSTISSGAFVFRSRRGWFLGNEEGVVGQTLPGTVVLRYDESSDVARTLRHETVHILQQDFAFHAAGSSLEGWMLGHHHLTRRIHETVDFNLVIPLSLTLAWRGFGIDYVNRPHEAEALFLAGG